MPFPPLGPGSRSPAVLGICTSYTQTYMYKLYSLIGRYYTGLTRSGFLVRIPAVPTRTIDRLGPVEILLSNINKLYLHHI